MICFVFLPARGKNVPVNDWGILLPAGDARDQVPEFPEGKLPVDSGQQIQE